MIIRRSIIDIGIVAMLAATALPATAATSDALLAGFERPPQAARPQVWWHWMSGNVSAEGARLDLGWMERMGIGGVHAFSGGALEPTVISSPQPFMSEGWRAAYRDSALKARADGLDVVIAGSPGWSETGGPWVEPAQAMKKYGWTETRIKGGGKRRLHLPAPPPTTGPFLAVAPQGGVVKLADGTAPQAFGEGPVIAFRDDFDDPPAARFSSPQGDVSALAAAPADLGRALTLALPEGGDASLDIQLGEARTIRAITLAISPLPAVEVLASDDGQSFRLVRSIPQTDAEKPAAEQTIALPPTKARFFRMRFAHPRLWRKLPDLPPALSQAPPKTLQVSLVRLETAPRIDHFEAKAGFQSIVDPGSVTPAGPGIDPASVIDLTSRVGAGGQLDWSPPPGHWTILRFGWSLTGATNGPAEPSATGLEVDKLDPAAVRNYVETLFSLYRDKAGIPLGPAGINGLLTDSWEAGVQNWTPRILTDFRRLRGYDPTPWLPVLAGRVVGDTARSESFLYDFRQTLRDDLVSAHYAVLAAAAHRHRMTYYTEVEGDTPRAIVDGMTAKARADIPTGEFWYRPFASDPGEPALVADLKEAASAAHVYGRKLVGSESLTVAAGRDPWSFSPAMLKPVADEIFALGVNRFLIHESHHQPFADRKPGLMLGIFGQFFNRNDSWAEEARPWVDYLARTSWMLQQGHYVADVGYFYGEDENLTQRFEHHPEADVPPGFGFDYINREALLTRLRVKGGRIAAAGGTDYRILYVPPDVRRMSLPVLRRLEALVRAGAVIVAPRPSGGLGMGSPDGTVQRLAERLWPDQPTRPRTIGKGRLYDSQPLSRVLALEHVEADAAAPQGADILSLHRRSPGTDIYFVSNQSDRPVTEPFTFRVAGREPEWWSAEDGSVRPLSFRSDGRRTRLALPLGPRGAGFVVFRHPTAATQRDVVAPSIVRTAELAGPWDLTFEPGRGAPASARFATLSDWAKNDDQGIRYFSGAATYRRHLSVTPEDLGAGGRVLLDLGDVRELAVVSVNGKPAGTAWHPPYRLDITKGLRAGDNLVEIKVVNLWVNRLIGDRQPGVTPIAFAPQSPYKADSPLRPSGLLGPVQLVFENGGQR